MPNPAIFYEPSTFSMEGPSLMGINAAAHSFLRAAVAGREDGPLFGYTRTRGGFQQFRKVVEELDPSATAEPVPTDRPDQLRWPGLLYLGDPQLDMLSRLRLRAGSAAYSLCGLTHTISPRSIVSIGNYFHAPVQPWDALICTSRSVEALVRRVLEASWTELSWRLKPAVRPEPPQLPVIPLGVHCDDFVFDEGERAASRAALELTDDETAALFLGRLDHRTKAHPVAMARGLQAAAERTGRKVALVLCGRFASETVEAHFRSACAQAAPDVRTLVVDGREANAPRTAWTAADLFVSLSDNIQESFGLTPLEAMAAGVPAVVSDWDGYRETVQDGVHGFRVPTWAPGAGAGEPFARALEGRAVDNTAYYALTSQTVSVDMAVLVDRLANLIESADLRRRMGEAGRRDARAHFDWPVIYARYRQLWAELAERRAGAAPEAAKAPRAWAAAPDPFAAFADHPSRLIALDTTVTLADAAAEAWLDDPLFGESRGLVLVPAAHKALMAALTEGPLTVAQLATRLGVGRASTAVAVAALAKMGVVRLD